MHRELLDLLIELTVAGSAAIAVVLMLRRPLRSAFGSGVTYLAWLLVPIAQAAVVVPAAAVDRPWVPPLAPGVVVLQSLPALSMAEAPIATSVLVLVAWWLGAIAMGWRLVRQQAGFIATLGRLEPRDDGRFQSQATLGLPAVVGWRARVVLPRDFESRFDPAQQVLVLCHEDVHRRRGDLVVNALVAFAQAVFWFNPLFHVAARRLRFDQELACDAEVLRCYPELRRTYGEALLKAEMAGLPLPLGCHGFGSHPLKERIAMLKRPVITRFRLSAGVIAVALLATGSGWIAWAAQPATTIVAVPGPGELAATLSLRVDMGEEVTRREVQRAGETRVYRFDQQGLPWDIALKLSPMGDGTVFAEVRISRDGSLRESPSLLFRPGQGAAIKIGTEEADGTFKGVALSIDVTPPEALPLTATADAISARAAALLLAGEAGLGLENPDALDDARKIAFDFRSIPAIDALRLIAAEDGLVVSVDGNRVRFEPGPG